MPVAVDMSLNGFFVVSYGGLAEPAAKSFFVATVEGPFLRLFLFIFIAFRALLQL